MTAKNNFDNGNNRHVIFVGGKPFMNYVTAVVMQFTVKGAEKVVVKSRGKFISRAVDIAEVVKNRFLKDQIVVDNIDIASEEFTNKEGQQVTVSTLDISLKKTGSGLITSTKVKDNSKDVSVEAEVAETNTVTEVTPKVEVTAPVENDVTAPTVESEITQSIE